MKHIRTLTATGVALLLAAGCGDTDDLGPGSEPDPAPQEEAEDAAAPEEAAEEDAPDELDIDEDDGIEEGQFLEEFDEPVVYESNGVRLSITGIGFTSMDSPVVDDDTRDFLEDDTETLLALEMTVSNDAGEEINLFANQGTIQIGRQQVEADLWFSDSFAGEMRDGVDDDGMVIWQLTTPFDELVELGELTYVASAPSSNETFESIAEDIELQVTWTP